MAGTGRFVIVGAGMAGAKAAEALRSEGFGGDVVLLGEEQHRPYERPPLSKDYLLGTAELDSAFVHPQTWYADHDIDLRLGTRARELDRAAQQVRLADGRAVDYDNVLLVPGASPRALPIPGTDAPGVHYLRRFEDAESIKNTIAEASRLVVIGAGWIGLEVTAAARQAGVEVVVIETEELPLLRVLGPELAEVFAGLHSDHGVEFRFRSQVAEVTTTNGQARGVQLADGTHVPCDAVLVAVGASPNTQLAEDAGLTVVDGIVVDAALRTDDPHVFAAGDVANAFHPLLGRHIRVEHWANALNQPASAARSMLGQDVGYDELPYFFTDQYDLGMEYLGHVDPEAVDEIVIRGDRAAREFIAFWMVDNQVRAGMNVNVWDVTDPIKALIRSGRPVDSRRLADPNVPLEELAAE